MANKSDGATPGPSSILVRSAREADLPSADRIMRLAFGTFLGLEDPLSFFGDGDYVHSRFRTDPTAAFVAESEGRVVGSIFAANWGSLGFFGPLTVDPQFWGNRVAQQLLAPVMDCFDAWGTQHAGLYTNPNSPKHLGLYQKFGFWPRFLRPIMSRNISAEPDMDFERFSMLDSSEQDSAISECGALTHTVFDGLDLRLEIRSVAAQSLGETLLIRDAAGVHGELLISKSNQAVKYCHPPPPALRFAI